MNFLNPTNLKQIASGQFGAIHICHGPKIRSAPIIRVRVLVKKTNLSIWQVVPLSTTSSRRCALVDVFAGIMALRILSGSSSISKKNGSFISNRSGILNEEEHPSPVAVEMIEYGVTEGYCIVMERCARVSAIGGR